MRAVALIATLGLCILIWKLVEPNTSEGGAKRDRVSNDAVTSPQRSFPPTLPPPTLAAPHDLPNVPNGPIDSPERAAAVLSAVFADDTLRPEDQRPEFLAALRDTGSSTEVWTARARDVAVRRSSPLTSVRAVECYRAGCYVEFESANANDLADVAAGRDVRRPEVAWDGDTIMTPIEEVSAGRFLASVILVRPR
jgi:hypothetical protein